ncbi:MAG: hypothetical protein ACHQIL_06915 [Steroidobacterales bacterium]
MQIGKPPVIDGARGADPPANAQGATLRQGAPAAPAADRADIRPLSIAAALQILIAEVQGTWSLLLSQPASPSQPPSPPASPAPPDNPLDAAMRLMQTFLQSLPASGADADTFLAAHDGLLAGLARGMDQAMAVVAAWRDTPREAIDALAETRSMVFAALGEDLPNAAVGAWVIRPEWLEFAPRIEQLRRRRRARRRLLDPDLPLPDVDDERNA